MAELPDPRARDPEALARFFRYFGEVETPRLGSRVYTAFSLGVAGDARLLEMAARVAADQPAPNVLFAAVHELLLRDDEAGKARAELAAWYPSISGAAIPETDPWPAFREFCLANAARLSPILSSGRTQTCVVHRCAVMLPAIASLPRVVDAGGRVALHEIGPSAGLNLRLDRYRYDYGGGLVWGGADAEPVLGVERRGRLAPPLPERLEVVARRGLELSPIDLDDRASLRWLRALVWPEHVERLRAMDAALAVAERVPVEIRAGDATRDVEAWIAEAPARGATVVFATHVFYQIPRSGRREILAGLARVSGRGPLDLIVMDSSGEGDSVVRHHGFEGGRRVEARTLARSDSHGRWIEWLSEADR